jgi:HAD superfamily hydrolase (TIGR01662 family)
VSRRALFLDRDGTLIVDVGYPRSADDVQLIPGAAEALRTLQNRYALVVISNQSGIARGIKTPEHAPSVQQRFTQNIAAQGVQYTGRK